MNHALELIITLPYALNSGRPITLSIQVNAYCLTSALCGVPNQAETGNRPSLFDLGDLQWLAVVASLAGFGATSYTILSSPCPTRPSYDRLLSAFGDPGIRGFSFSFPTPGSPPNTRLFQSLWQSLRPSISAPAGVDRTGSGFGVLPPEPPPLS